MYLRLAVAALGTFSVLSASAQSSAPAKPLWEFGAVGLGVSQQAYPGADQQIGRALLFPFFIYRGPVLRADGEGVGVRALKTPKLELDIGFSGAFGSGSDDIEARRGMPRLGTLVEFGPRVKWNLGPGAGGNWRAQFPLRGVFDLSDGFAGRGIAFEPELVYDAAPVGGWSWSGRVGAVFGNRKLNDTFYGVAPRFATATRPAYEASAGLTALRASVTLTRPLTRDWFFFSFARIDSVSGAANRDSPLVRQTTGGSVGVGLSYTWLRSERSSGD